MTDADFISIGDLAERTGLAVRTIPFYSDSGVVPETARSPSGYRPYGAEAIARLDLVRALRDLGLSRSTIRALLAEQESFNQVAAAHVGALDVQIARLRLRRAVLRAATKTTTTEEAALMHKLVAMSDAERQRVIEDFLEEATEAWMPIPSSWRYCTP